MNIGIIGTGDVGSALGIRWARGGHKVIMGTRNPLSSKIKGYLEKAGSNASAAANQVAVDGSDILCLATPWNVTEDILKDLNGLDGKILIDATNPIAPDLTLTHSGNTSGGEMVATWADGAKVVKAFNTTGWENMANADYGSGKPAMFICGNDADALKTVCDLTEELGFEAIVCGDIAMSRYLEPMTMLWIHLAIVQKRGRDIAFALLKR